MSNISGYRAVIEAASFYGRFFTGQMTAAGRVPPAKVFVIGAGVAGLSAIGTARGLGAIVRAFDTRPSVKDQVTSMGAEFIEIEMKGDEGEGACSQRLAECHRDLLRNPAGTVTRTDHKRKPGRELLRPGRLPPGERPR